MQTAGLEERKGDKHGRTESKTGMGKEVQQDVGGADSPLPTRTKLFESEIMNEARQAFESYMATKGRNISDDWNGKRYTNININTKWIYFLVGWTMKGQGK